MDRRAAASRARGHVHGGMARARPALAVEPRAAGRRDRRRTYAGKDWREKHLAAEDGALFEFIEKVRAKLPAAPARVFMVGGGPLLPRPRRVSPLSAQRLLRSVDATRCRRRPRCAPATTSSSISAAACSSTRRRASALGRRSAGRRRAAGRRARGGAVPDPLMMDSLASGSPVCSCPGCSASRARSRLRDPRRRPSAPGEIALDRRRADISSGAIRPRPCGCAPCRSPASHFGARSRSRRPLALADRRSARYSRRASSPARREVGRTALRDALRALAAAAANSPAPRGSPGSC